MNYADNQFKWVAVLNKKVALPQLLNALGHLAVGLRPQCIEEAAGFFHSYEGADGKQVASISNWPVIVLRADNGNQLRTLRANALTAGLPCQAFLDTMLGTSAEDQLQKTKTTADDKAEYFAVMIFGKSDVLQTLTKKFSLFTQPAADSNPAS